MPRKPRKRSNTGIYHVMLRAVNGQTIFQDNEDYEKLIQTIGEFKEVSKYEIYAYCIMSNHVHLLIKEIKEDLGIIFRRIGAKFVYWYNWKYKRRGHLFQDRYKSEVVEDDKYFLTVLRYIHQNPIKAGIVNDVAKYSWSSYKEYLGKDSICDIKFALGLFDDDNKKALALFRKFNSRENNDQCLDYEEPVRIDDVEATTIVTKLTGVKDPRQIIDLKKDKRNKIIKELRNSGLSIRQIERLTGVSFGVIRGI